MYVSTLIQKAYRLALQGWGDAAAESGGQAILDLHHPKVRKSTDLRIAQPTGAYCTGDSLLEGHSYTCCIAAAKWQKDPLN